MTDNRICEGKRKGPAGVESGTAAGAASSPLIIATPAPVAGDPQPE